MQLVQERPGSLEVRVVLAHGARPDVTADIGDAVRRRVPDQEVTVLRVPEIAPEPNGKIKLVKVLDSAM